MGDLKLPPEALELMSILWLRSNGSRPRIPPILMRCSSGRMDTWRAYSDPAMGDAESDRTLRAALEKWFGAAS
jgi:hypothetical protein